MNNNNKTYISEQDKFNLKSITEFFLKVYFCRSNEIDLLYTISEDKPVDKYDG